MLLKQILDSARLSPQVSAGLLGVSPSLFNDWVTGQRSVPESMIDRLSTILGISSMDLRTTKRMKGNQADIAPAIWFKLRGEGLVDADRECVLLIRQLGYYINQLEEVTGKKPVGWKNLFESIRDNTDIQAPPREQGRQAARMFRESTGLGHGCKGIGDVFRGYLRNQGILIIESPLPESKVEGCSFYLGSTTGSFERPCVFSNSHHNTWFRRNQILMHEIGHAIFDVQSAGASIDFEDDGISYDVAEERAQAFSFEALVPREVLRHLSQTNGIRWDKASSNDLATLIAGAHVEQKALVSAALEHEFINEDQAIGYRSLDISSELKAATEHALSTDEFLARKGIDQSPWIEKRNTTIPVRSLRLPVTYITSVLDAVDNDDISRAKAAELLMIDEETFDERFPLVGQGEH
jgi:Zn-dependent peptidase ImmA (M78 family)